jgi:hypothetical protein
MTSLWPYFCPCTLRTIAGHFVPCCADIPDDIPNVERYPEVPDFISTMNLSLFLEGALQVAELSI